MCIYKGKFIIFRVDNGWIVYNTAKEFKNGHTHLKSKTSALAAVDFVQKEKIPRKTGNYYLKSLIRLSNNEEYVAKVNELLNVRKSKEPKQKYCRIQGYK